MNRYVIAILALVLCSTPSWAHNTNVTHPVITLEAVRLIQEADKDQGQYSELYRKAELNSKDIQGLTKYDFFWGVWHTDDWTNKENDRLYNTMTSSEDDEGGFLDSLNPLFQPYSRLYGVNSINVISGVVREDHPVNKVLNHFYHAYTGAKLPNPVKDLLTVNSKKRALDFLVEATNLYGYEAYASVNEFDPEEWQNLSAFPADKVFAKKLAFQSFGESLHHVEDMSSIAHVQSDSHLVLGMEKDDYEGLYLPQKVFQLHEDPDQNPDLENWFKDTRTTSAAEVSSVQDIWPDPQQEMDWDTQSLARKVYNASVFQGDLKTPGWSNSVLSAVLFSSPLSDEEARGGGELRDMFGDRLKWQRVSLAQWPVWHIDGVGNWNYVQGSMFDAWWPATEFGGPEKSATTGHRYYYIEQKMTGTYDRAESKIAQAHMRENLFKDYDPSGNNKVNKNVEENVLERFSRDLVPLAIQYAAGFSQYWYDRVNSPPYLKALTVKQNSISGAVASYPFVGYQAHWQNIKSTLKAHDDQEAIFTAKRKLKRDRLTQPLYRNTDVTLTLYFSEPILAPASGAVKSDTGSKDYIAETGFKLGFEKESVPQGDAGRVVMFDDETMKTFKYRNIDSSTPENMVGSTWEVTIGKEVFKDEALNHNLEGAVRLIVYARDRNNHKTEQDSDKGVELDDKPDTPARVYASYTGGEFTTAWHDGASPLTPEYSSSQDENGDYLKAGAFAYDQGKGDRSHILWFSPEVKADELLSIYPKNEVDTISITSLPEPEEQ